MQSLLKQFDILIGHSIKLLDISYFMLQKFYFPVVFVKTLNLVLINMLKNWTGVLLHIEQY